MSNQTNINVQPLFSTGGPIDGDKAKTDGVWMSVQEASNATGLSMGTLRRYIKLGKIKSRRRGRTDRSKLEVFVTQAFLPDQPGQSEYFGAEEEVEADEDDDFVEIDQPDQPDQPGQFDQSMQTLIWLREKLDEKDALIKEKDSKIEILAHELAGAHYRNGYLESEKNNFQEKLLLLEDKSKDTAVEAVSVSAVQTEQPGPRKIWTKIGKWITGK